MFRKLIAILFVFMLCVSQASAQGVYFGRHKVVSGGGGTDYTQDANCVAAFYMNSSTTETDRSGNDADVTVGFGTPETNNDVPSGYSGTSRVFSSAGEEYLVHADGKSTDISGADQNISIAFWIKITNQVATTDYRLITKAAGDEQYRIYYDNSEEKVVFRLSANGTDETQADGPAIDIGDGSWHHIACVYDDSLGTGNMIVYVDDTAGTTVNYTSGIYNGTSSFYIGGRGRTYNLEGKIDEIIILDRSLSATEVSNIYTDGIDGTKGGKD